MRKLTALIAILALAGCGNESPTGGDDGLDPTTGPVAAVSVEQGAGQRGPPDHALPDSIVGRVVDDAGNPVTGNVVNFEAEGSSSFEARSLQTNENGRVFNRLITGDTAWTRLQVESGDSARTARLVASNEGRPDEVSEFTFAVDPGDPVALSPITSVNESTNQDGRTAQAQLARLWWDQHRNPNAYKVSVDGPGEVVTCCGPGISWRRSIRPIDGETGEGTWTAWTLPDSTASTTGRFRVEAFGDGGIYICAVVTELGSTLDDCDGPPVG